MGWCPLLDEGSPPACHYRAGYNTIDLDAVFDALFGKSLRECDDGRIDGRDCSKTRFGI
jgi:hypothetical protein